MRGDAKDPGMQKLEDAVFGLSLNVLKSNQEEDPVVETDLSDVLINLDITPGQASNSAALTPPNSGRM